MARRPRSDPDSLVPLYVQAAGYVAVQITGGELTVGARLPSEHHLAEQGASPTRRSPDDARAARAGLVATVVGKGTYVISRHSSQNPEP
jgi:DNA-binding GntR family transcriptional regulator